jgi:type II secretory pathway pseudopilin PulG
MSLRRALTPLSSGLGSSNQESETSISGFTILEILLAVVILTVGLLGLLAVFPVAMDSGRRAVESTNAVIITQSVEQAIRDGLKQHKGQSRDGRWTYFIFHHDGVTDEYPTEIDKARPGADYYILLPSPDPESTTSVDRDTHWDRGKTFVFPESDGLTWVVEDGSGEREVDNGTEDDFRGSPNGNGNPLLADDDADDREVVIENDAGDRLDSYRDIDVRRVYTLSNNFFDEEMAEDFDIVDEDPISQYSFAFAIRPAKQDSSLGIQMPDSSKLVPAGELYEVDIMVFRTFREGTRNADPIYRSQILVHR